MFNFFLFFSLFNNYIMHIHFRIYKIDLKLGHNSSLNTFQMFNIVKSIFSEYNIAKLRLKHIIQGLNIWKSCSSYLHMLTRLCSEFFKLDFSSEPRTSGCKNWTYKRHRNQISNCQHPSFHTKIKAIQKKKKKREKNLLLLH